ncbi:hypothetical protein TBS_30890 [Thermobispora bispora]|uniref:PilT protein domain protein n=1 Tax=Thermobispora bispora (strain ATCC 19993 / DSM 43833 / CBS 139.67 / JCM 10125 / KCTC 9307 / NBRC 14880 / R51) TaxID=469371 RepID=D6Y7M9_THEBD|nr:hypothetical protein [Thermobispora bispora]ADG89740.1 hypothetical protein Tbis_3044 [Thermobispora bispora DSM 43833]MBX6167622.1 hypothetical protein [Thermobispora bispora]QSI49925.1 hypothetical protein CYL17_18260 [Thermobispora bispora]QSI50027.1 hypothetical protein CYL17_18830 [Thermobispora bispora]
MTTNPPDQLTGMVLDAAVLVDLVTTPLYTAAFAHRAAVHGVTLLVPAAALAEAWQTIHGHANTDHAGIERLNLFLASPLVVVEPLDETTARRIGELAAGRTITPDVPAAHVALACRTRGWSALAGEPARVRAIDPTVEVVTLPGT